MALSANLRATTCFFRSLSISRLIFQHLCNFISLGKVYDLSDFAKEVKKADFKANPGFSLAYKFCGIADVVPGCATDKSAFCMLGGGGQDFVHGSRWQSEEDVESAVSRPDGVFITFQNTHDSTMGAIHVHVSLTCANTPSDPVLAKQTSAADESFLIEFKQNHPAGCPATADGGLSGGSVFLIIFFVSALVYVAGGCVWNWKRNGLALGVEACPQRAFWSSVAANCVEGVRFTKSGCKKPSAYSADVEEHHAL
jgi:hypothetical protein